jgi:hypothetical protein
MLSAFSPDERNEMTTTTSRAYEIGDRVSYEDMANPRRTGTVVEIVERGGETPSGLPLPTGTDYRVRFDDRDETVSDLRQAGWKRVPKPRNASAIAKEAQRIAKATNPRVAMQLLTAEDVRNLLPLYAQDGRGEDATVAVKFFGTGRWTWFVTEASALVLDAEGELQEVALDDVHDPSRIGDIRFFGKVVSGLGPDCDELTYFSLRELCALRFQFGLAVERDRHFDPAPLSEAR